MKKTQINIILAGIAQRLKLAYEWAQDSEDSSYELGIVEGAYFVASCEIVQYVFPLIGIDDGLGTSDLIGMIEGSDKDNLSSKKILKKLKKFIESVEKDK